MKKSNNNPALSMTRGEIIGGVIFLPFYILLIPLIISLGFSIIGWPINDSLLNLIYYYVCFFVIVIIFHKYLAASFRAFCRSFFPAFQAIVLGFVFYYAMFFLMSIIIVQVSPGLTNPNDELVYGLLDVSPSSMIVCAVLLAPLVEEALFRGLIFGRIRKKNTIAAYIIMYIAFAAMHLWDDALYNLDWTLLLNALQYLPASIVFGWCYIKGGSIWCPVFLHMLVNGISFAAYFAIF